MIFKKSYYSTRIREENRRMHTFFKLYLHLSECNEPDPNSKPAHRFLFFKPTHHYTTHTSEHVSSDIPENEEYA